ncbi:MAG: tetratricopeptide repeat protein [Rectinemataceae bacterium]
MKSVWPNIAPLVLAFAILFPPNAHAEADPSAAASAALASVAASLEVLRDAVYDSRPPGEVEALAQSLAKAAQSPLLDTIDRALSLSRIEYFVARSWNESGDKNKAIPHFEAGIEYARLSMESGEHTSGLMALTKPLSELCLLKDMGFLIANGPKISQYAKKILAMEPGHAGATITLSAAKAYPPAVFGGRPKEAIKELSPYLAAHGSNLAKDELFDIWMCLGTAAAKLGRKADALRWFTAALELYPHNIQALRERDKAIQ